MEDKEAGEVELDEIVGGDGGSGEGSDNDLDEHHDEEEDADGESRDGYSRVLPASAFGVVCIGCSFDAVKGEVSISCA